MTRRLSLLMLVLGVLVIVLPTAAAGGGCHPTEGAEVTPSDDATIAIEECVFGDVVTYVQPGDEVTWTNKDYAPHTVTGALDSWGSNETLYRNAKVSHAFEDEGVYPYFCSLHPSMVGAVVVGDATAMGTTGAAPGVVEEIDLAASSETQATGRDGGGMTAVTALSIGGALIGAAFVVRFVLRRKVGVTPAA